MEMENLGSDPELARKVFTVIAEHCMEAQAKKIRAQSGDELEKTRRARSLKAIDHALVQKQ